MLWTKFLDFLSIFTILNENQSVYHLKPTIRPPTHFSTILSQIHTKIWYKIHKILLQNHFEIKTVHRFPFAWSAPINLISFPVLAWHPVRFRKSVDFLQFSLRNGQGFSFYFLKEMREISFIRFYFQFSSWRTGHKRVLLCAIRSYLLNVSVILLV